MHNPSPRELYKKLRQALAAFEDDPNRVSFHDIPIQSEIEKLGLSNEREYRIVIYECIQLALVDPKKAYRKPAPPGKSTRHKQTEGLTLWAFSVKGCSFDPNREMYFKFCLKEKTKGIYYLHISCHEDYPV